MSTMNIENNNGNVSIAMDFENVAFQLVYTKEKDKICLQVIRGKKIISSSEFEFDELGYLSTFLDTCAIRIQQVRDPQQFEALHETVAPYKQNI